jgi:S1-C subfamily serine protease
MPRTTIAALTAAVALAGAGAGAAVYAVAEGGGSTTTVTTRVAASAPAPVANTTGSTLSVADIYKQSVPGIVEIVSTVQSQNQQGNGFGFGGGNQSSQSSSAEGTGFVYDGDGHIVTNQHVIAGASSIKVTLTDGSTYTAKVTGSDPSTDIAVLKIDAPSSKLHPLSLGDSGALEVGDGVVAIGAPFGLENTATTGIVSALNRQITSPNNTPIEGAIQTDAAINHGNSGGPLFDLQGKVIGITSQIESDSGGNDGVGFAVPSNLVKTIAAQLISTGKVEHPLLGVQVETLPANVASTLGQAAGVAIATVQSGSGAAAAGLKAAATNATIDGQSYPVGGDVITAVDGKTITTAEQLRTAIAAKKVGDTVKLTVVRDGKTRTVTAKLGSQSSTS